MDKKSTRYIYGTDCKPPAFILAGLGLEHFVKFSFLLICTQGIASAAGVSTLFTAQLISISLIAGALASLLMTWRAKCFIPAQASVPFFILLLTAAKLGGMPAVLGTTLLAGALQCLYTPLFHFGKKIFDHATVGFIILMLGIWASLVGVSELFHPSNLGQLALRTSFSETAIKNQSALLGMIGLWIMLIMRLGKRSRLFCILFGMLIPWWIAYLLDLIPAEKILNISNAPWFALPHFSLPHYQFAWPLLAPTIIVAFLASSEVFALITIIFYSEQKPEQEITTRVKRGNFAAGAGVFLSGLMGAVAQSPIPGSIGDLLLTGAYSRYIVYFYAPALCCLAFCPKLAMLMLTIPAAVNGAAVVFMGAVMIMYAFNWLRINQFSAAHLQAFSFAFLLGLATDILPRNYLANTPLLPWVTNSALAIGLFAYIILRYVFSQGQQNA